MNPPKLLRLILLIPLLCAPLVAHAQKNDAVMIKSTGDIFQDINFPSTHPMKSEGVQIRFSVTGSANKVPIMDGSGALDGSVFPASVKPPFVDNAQDLLKNVSDVTKTAQFYLGNITSHTRSIMDFPNYSSLSGTHWTPATVTGPEALRGGKTYDGTTLRVGSVPGQEGALSYTETPASPISIKHVTIGATGGDLIFQTSGDTRLTLPTSGVVATVGHQLRTTSDDTVSGCGSVSFSAVKGPQVDMTCTSSPITAITGITAGRELILRFTGATALTNGTTSTSLRLPGATSFTTTAGQSYIAIGGASDVVTLKPYDLTSDTSSGMFKSLGVLGPTTIRGGKTDQANVTLSDFSVAAAGPKALWHFEAGRGEHGTGTDIDGVGSDTFAVSIDMRGGVSSGTNRFAALRTYSEMSGALAGFGRQYGIWNEVDDVNDAGFIIPLKVGIYNQITADTRVTESIGIDSQWLGNFSSLMQYDKVTGYAAKLDIFCSSSGCFMNNPTGYYARIKATSNAAINGTSTGVKVADWACTNTHTTATFTAATSDLITSTAHGLNPGNVVRVSNSGGALPGGLSANTDYYVLTANWTVNAFNVGLTSTSAAVDITSTGSGTQTWVHDTCPTESDGIYIDNSISIGRVNNYAIRSDSVAPSKFAGTISVPDDAYSDISWVGNLEVPTKSAVQAKIVTLTGGGGSGTVTATGGSLTANSVVLGAGTVDTKVVSGIASDGLSKLILGVAGTSVGSIDFRNATSGTITIVPPTGALASNTLTLPAATGTLAYSNIFNVGNTNITITGTPTLVLLNAAITGNRTYIMPAASSYTAGSGFTFDDPSGQVGAFFIALNVSGTDTVNGTYNSIRVNNASGSISFISDGAANWSCQSATASARLKGRTVAGTGTAYDITMSEALDSMLGTTRGSVIERGASLWGLVAPSSTAGQAWITNGTGADPSYSDQLRITKIINQTSNGIVTTTLGDGTLAIVSTLGVASGGTGLAALTAHDLIIGNGTSAATLLAPGTADYPLVSGGASADPSYVNQLNIAKIKNLTTNGLVWISNSDGTLNSSAGIPIASAGVPASGGNALAPVIVYSNVCTAVTSGSPTDLSGCTITIPAGISRYRVPQNAGASAGGSGYVSPSGGFVGTWSSGSLAVFTASAGGGTQVMTTTVGPASDIFNSCGSSNVSTIYTATTLYVREIADAGNANTFRYYMYIEPLL
jgi:hypothetical protein